MSKPTARRRTAARATTSVPRHYHVSRLDQVRLLAHPLRLRLFEAFALEPRTTQQVARALGLAPTRLYHHVNALQRVGLLELKETRQVRGATEKYYQAAGRVLDIEPGLFACGPVAGRGATGAPGGGAAGAGGARSHEHVALMMEQLLEGTRAELMQALARYAETPEPLRPAAARIVLYGSPARLAAMRRRVVKWLEQFAHPTKGAKKAAAPGKKNRGAAQGASRASLTLVFTAGPGSRSGSD